MPLRTTGDPRVPAPSPSQLAQLAHLARLLADNLAQFDLAPDKELAVRELYRDLIHKVEDTDTT